MWKGCPSGYYVVRIEHGPSALSFCWFFLPYIKPHLLQYMGVESTYHRLPKRMVTRPFYMDQIVEILLCSLAIAVSTIRTASWFLRRPFLEAHAIFADILQSSAWATVGFTMPSRGMLRRAANGFLLAANRQDPDTTAQLLYRTCIMRGSEIVSVVFLSS